MPAIASSLVAREAFSQIAKRENWAAQEAGVVVVFCIVFIVAVGLIRSLHPQEACRAKGQEGAIVDC